MRNYTFVDYATQAYSATVAILILFFHNGTVPGWPWLIAAHVLGLGLVHWLTQAEGLQRRSRFFAFLRHFYPVLLYTPFFCETGQLNRMFFPGYLDELAIRADEVLFGCQPGAILMRNLPWMWLSELLYASYFSYYLMIAGVGIVLFLRSRQQFFHYILVVSFVFYVCYLIYIILPIIGPQVLSHEIPTYQLPADLERFSVTDAYPATVKAGGFFHLMAWIYANFEAPGAALPSSHIAVALCNLYFTFRYLRPIRYVHLVLVTLLCVSTVYCHYHYGVDVLTGLLTAAALIPLANRLYARFQSTANQ